MTASAVVVGAGVFGASTARELAGRGWAVTLVEQYTPGDVRASSGGESRLIRYSHGENLWYMRSARTARDRWRDLEQEVGEDLLVDCGVAWFARRDDGWESHSERALRGDGIPVERLDAAQAQELFPSLRADDLASVLLEPDAGALRARRATRALATAAQRRGARLLTGAAKPSGQGVHVNGERLDADAIVWACGPWLATLFPRVVDLRVTKQDVTFFGAGPAWSSPPAPGWVDYDGAVYGLGDLDGRGFKCAPDAEGPEFDPDADPRVLSAESERLARDYLAWRFPALAQAPLVGSRTCQYTVTVDTHFVAAAHPDGRGRVWLVGGGSGHGFKHGPSLGAHVADLIEGSADPDPRFALGAREPARALRTSGSDGSAWVKTRDCAVED
ncbi:MAG TPA: FAD-dependent oxidoreductase [Egibacteraceae bacterium]|nr:FAD-dependent oxidoreductase [Egibacteraceae bacterium]